MNTEELELTEEQIVEEQQDEAPEEEEVIVQLGDEEPEQQEEAAPEWVKELRRANREKDKRIRELEALAQPDKPKLGPKPTLEECDYDSAAFEQKLEQWYEEKRAADAAEAEQRTAQEQAEKAWQDKLTRFEEGKNKLGVRDYEDAEATVADMFDKPFPGINAPDVRINLIKQGSDDPATLIYALGRNPKKAAELAAINDPVEFAFALGKMSAAMKVTRKAATAPEKKIAGTSGSASSDATLEKLREEAAKTGDFSKVVQYKRQLQA